MFQMCHILQVLRGFPTPEVIREGREIVEFLWDFQAVLVPKAGDSPIAGWFIWKLLSKWMIWGYLNFMKHP